MAALKERYQGYVEKLVQSHGDEVVIQREGLRWEWRAQPKNQPPGRSSVAWCDAAR